MEVTRSLRPKQMPFWGLCVTFTGVWVAALLGLFRLHAPEGEMLQKLLYALLGATLLAGVATFAAAGLGEQRDSRPVWVCPLAAGGLALVLFSLGYLYLGVWPVGPKSVMMVDLHHQYGPLLSELRDLLLNGDMSTYSYHVGLGTNFVPTFAYYLASPLNLLLVLFPQRLLTEGVLVITLLKGAAAAAGFAACAQYVTGRRSTGAVVTALLYTLSGYSLAYSWNVMWLDVVALLPVVVLCMERMLRTRRMPAYVLTLALALFVNYYIGFMLCIFLVLYMAVWLFREQRSTKDWLMGCVRFGFGSLLAGGLAACLLIPTALSLGRTSAAGGELGEFASNFPLFELVGRMLFGAEPTIRSGNLPNLYCGIPAVLLAPIFLSHREIPARRRVCYGVLLTVMLFSCTLSQWDLLWHGLHAPNDLPYRFSFLVCFVLLLMAAQALANLKTVTKAQVLASVGGCAAYVVVWEMFAGERGPSATVVYANLALLAIYGAVLLVGATKKAPARMVSRLLLVAVCLELLVGTGDTLIRMNQNEYFTDHSAYVDNAKTEANAAAVQRVQELGREELGEQFFRLEYLPRTSCVDPALHHYAGLTTFASSNPYQTTLFMGNLGYAINGVNSYLYHSFVAPVDSLFGMRYVILSSRLSTHPQLTLVDQLTVQDQTRYIYRNEGALPLGYMVHRDIDTYTGIKYSPFECVEQLYSAMTGDAVDLFHSLEFTTDDASASISLGNAFRVSGGDYDVVFSATVEEEGQYFAYVDCRAADSISVHRYDENGVSKSSWTVTTHEPYIIDMGTLRAGETAEAWINSDTSASGHVYVVRLDAEEMERQLATLRAGGLTVTAMTETHIEGTVTAAEEGNLLLTIPYDKGWSVTVDGKPAATFPLAATEDGTDGALLCVKVPAGQHKVVLDYEAPGLLLGLLVSGVSVVVLIVVWVISALLNRKKRATISVPAELEEEPFTPPTPMEEKPLPLSLEELMGQGPWTDEEDAPEEEDAPAEEDIPAEEAPTDE